MTLDGFIARLHAIWHKIIHPTHKLVWKSSPAEGLCKGDIVCDTCNVLFWCRYYDLSEKEKNEIDYDNI